MELTNKYGYSNRYKLSVVIHVKIGCDYRYFWLLQHIHMYMCIHTGMA